MDLKHGRHAIDINVPSAENSYVRSKVCAGASCGFSDNKTSSMDAEERSSSMWKLGGGVVVCFIFMAVEVVGGIKANSLAILTDAAHLLSDVAAFAISLFSVWASGWEATPRQSYGFFRIEILGTLVSIQLIWLLTGILVYEAIDRLLHGSVEVEGSLMFGIAAVGLVVNIFMIFILGHDHGHGHHHGHGDHDHSEEDVENIHIHGLSVITKQPHHHHHHSGSHHDGHEDQRQPLLKSKRNNINVQGAYLHVLGDSIQSIGVMIGAAVIWYNPKWRIVDPICTLLFSIIVLYTTINMLRDILEVLMESTPREIDATSLERGLCEIDEVVAIHELHIWAITVGKVLLACHVKISREANADMVLNKVVDYIRREYNISHVTIQIERE
ncbi:metal tolerance protein 1-like [Cynara cardunculus var. scolymus]|uniref:Cation efflux protein n=1 Tax=Cynara cardunculus var. scolymus TaxID=59895 RepID=A0A103XJ79_CYNCS|nr:metal tolerance protein 1-like [Cynara cardunculus var. scolymus]KVH91743.1 Cation efflux protein [Cynara cardunculus var. scolymus]